VISVKVVNTESKETFFLLPNLRAGQGAVFLKSYLLEL